MIVAEQAEHKRFANIHDAQFPKCIVAVGPCALCKLGE
jgi:hypothetical protein